ncbi:hypothetical protein TNCV_78141 [Trichonephila clavipes]|nr:hypothetical protein TNCV_78141 [Trichonephila clavipes]
MSCLYIERMVKHIGTHAIHGMQHNILGMPAIKMVCLLFQNNRDNYEVLGTNASDRSRRTATAGSDVVQSGRPIFDDFFQHLWPYIGNNTANVVFQMVKRLWLIRIDR